MFKGYRDIDYGGLRWRLIISLLLGILEPHPTGKLRILGPSSSEPDPQQG